MTTPCNHSRDLALISEHAKAIMAGSFDNIEPILALTNPEKNPPEIAELAETFGMMSVKVEARELALSRTVEQLRRHERELQETMRLREEFGRLFILVVLTVGLYNLMLGFAGHAEYRHDEGPTTIVALGLGFIGTLLLLCLYYIRKSGLPWAVFGFNLDRLRQSLIESTLFSSGVLVVMSLIKLGILYALPNPGQESLIDGARIDLFFWTYLLSAPAQEFIGRGTLLTCIERMLTGPHASRLAIVTTSVLFGAFHTLYSVELALCSMVASLAWGVLYVRHRNLIGVSLSHFLIGNGLILLNFELIRPVTS